MLVLCSGLGKVQEWIHDGPILDEQFQYIAGSFPASFLTSKEDDVFSTVGILRLLVILMSTWSRDGLFMVSGPVAIGVDRVHFKQGRTTTILGLPRKNNPAGWRPGRISVIHRVIRQSNVQSGVEIVNENLP